jgi:hypothetical protein
LHLKHIGIVDETENINLGGTCRSAAIYLGGFTAASVLGCIISGGLHGVVANGYNLGVGIILGVCLFLFFSAASFIFRADANQSFVQWLEIVLWAGSRNLRGTFKQKPSRWENVLFVITFDFMIKYICFPALLGLFVNQAIADSSNYDNGYNDYPDWLQVTAGVIVLGSMFSALIVFFIYPQFWDTLGGMNPDSDEVPVYVSPVRPFSPPPFHCLPTSVSSCLCVPGQSSMSAMQTNNVSIACWRIRVDYTEL